MANVKRMWELFDIVDSVILELAEGDSRKEELLTAFFVRLLCVGDGGEGSELEWRGIALVAQEDLPDEVEEINDELLHDAWSSRS